MRSICLYFQVHQPFRLKTYRFFNIGDDHQYFDEYQNRSIIRRIAEKCYLPANKLMLSLIREYGSAFKVSFSISGTALEQFQNYAPEVIRSFRELAATGNVEFLAETYAHSLASLGNTDEFRRQVIQHADAMEKTFGIRPTTFRNSELIFSDRIGEMVHEMGFSTIVTEGARHILGWKSPNFMYCSSTTPKLKLLLRNNRLSDDISFRFSTHSWSEWPLTTEKLVGWLNGIDPQDEIVNIFIDYETIGERQWKETGIFEFFRTLPKTVFSKSKYTFSTPSDLADKLQPVGPINVPYPISWADEERDLTSWLGNELQDEAFGKLYSIGNKVVQCRDAAIRKDWELLQTTDHFYYMCTKWFSDGTIHKYFNPYPSPYEAFINYMNVLSDFIIRVERDLVTGQTVTGAEKPAKIRKPAAKKKTPAAKPAAKKQPVKEAPAVPEKEKKAKKVTVKPAETINVSKPGEKPERKARSVTKKPVEKAVAKPEKIKAPEKATKKKAAEGLDLIPLLSDSKIKGLVKNLDSTTLVQGLRDAKKEIVQKLEKNMGAKVRKRYNEFLKKPGKVTDEAVEKAREAILKEMKSIM
jgi:alpha-amylase